MADVLLTHSYHLARDAKQFRKMQPYPPLGTLYAATALRSAGISVAVYDTMFAEPVSGFRAALEEHRPKIVVIYEDDFNFVTKMCLTHMRELASELAAIARSAGVTVIAHGSDATDHPRDYLDNGVDFILNGEVEQSLVDLCSALLQSRRLPAIPGLVRYSAVRMAAWRACCLRRPIPRGPVCRARRESSSTSSHTGVHGSKRMATSPPMSCRAAAVPITATGARSPSPAIDSSCARRRRLPRRSVNSRRSSAQSTSGLAMMCLHSIATGWSEFANAVESHGEVVPFKIQSRADLMSDATVSALKRAGCAEIWMGVESGSQKILDAMKKGLKLSAVYAARERLAAAGIRACYFLQFGYSGEGWAEICETVQLVRRTRPDDIGVSLSYPLPGTGFFERVQAQLGRKRNWIDSDDLCTIHIASYNDNFYHALRDALHAEVDGMDAPSGSSDPSTCESLWSRVYELEPVCRNRNVLSLPAESFA